MDTRRCEDVFEKFVEQKWKDTLNVAAAKPGGWEAGGINIEKTPAEKALALPRRILRPRV
jgi:hypothetical protein